MNDSKLSIVDFQDDPYDQHCGKDMTRVIVRGQIKAGRILLGLTQAELCQHTGISLITLRRIEAGGEHMAKVAPETLEMICEAMKGLGLQFLQQGEPATGPGVSVRLDVADRP